MILANNTKFVAIYLDVARSTLSHWQEEVVPPNVHRYITTSFNCRSVEI